MPNAVLWISGGLYSSQRKNLGGQTSGNFTLGKTNFVAVQVLLAMPLEYTTAAAPSLRKALVELDPKYCTRPPQKVISGCRGKVDFSNLDNATRLARVPCPETGGVATYYKLNGAKLPAECAILPVMDSRIDWKYDTSSNRQCALPYASGLVLEMTEYVKTLSEKEDLSKLWSITAVPQSMVPTLDLAAVSPSDPIAAWHYLRSNGFDACSLIGTLCGGNVCVYPCD